MENTKPTPEKDLQVKEINVDQTENVDNAPEAKELDEKLDETKVAETSKDEVELPLESNTEIIKEEAKESKTEPEHVEVVVEPKLKLLILPWKKL